MSVESACRKRLLHFARRFQERHKLSLATVSREAHGADHFLQSFESGEVTVTLKKYDEMLDFLRRGKRKAK